MVSELIDERRHALWHHTETLLLRNTPLPLSSLWERFLLDFVLPQHQSYPTRAAAGKAPEVGQEKRAMYQRSCALGPFDFTDDWVSSHRARNFIGFLDDVREMLAEDGYVRRRWWPVSRTEMLEVIKKEQEAKQAAGGGKRGGGGGGAASAEGSSSSCNSIKEEPHGVAPLGAGGEQRNLVKPSSSNKRKADDTSSTAVTTEPPTTRSIEDSGSKIKRQRQA